MPINSFAGARNNCAYTAWAGILRDSGADVGQGCPSQEVLISAFGRVCLLRTSLVTKATTVSTCVTEDC